MAKRKSTKKEKEVVEEVLEVKFSDIEYKVEDNIVIPAYDGELTFKYAKENVKEKEVKE